MRNGGKNNKKGKRGTRYFTRLTLGFLLLIMVIVILPYVSYATGFIVEGLPLNNMNLRGKSISSEDSIKLEWDTPDHTEPYTYKVYSKKPGSEEFQSISSTDLNKEVKVLNVYPNIGATINYTTYKGETRALPKAASAEMWMEEPNEYNSKGFGMGIIDVEPITLGEFNKDPIGELTDDDGKWKYDVIFFGSWDSNNDQDLTGVSSEALKGFMDSGRGVLFGHDTVSGNTGRPIFSTIRSYLNLKLRYFDGIDIKNIGSKQIKMVKSGLLTEYPWNIGEIGGTLDVPYTHSAGQVALGDVWMEFNNFTDSNYNSNMGWIGPKIGDENGKGTNNYYLTTWNNTAQIQIGHSNGSATTDEQKILANTLFYLSQLTTDTELTDRSAMEVYPPKFKSNQVNVTRTGSNIAIDFSEAEDVGSTFEYYVEATGQNTGAKKKSETIKVTNTSGLAGYSYVIDDKPSTVPDNKVNTTKTSITTPKESGTPKYVHIVAVDKNGNSLGPIHKALDNTPPRAETKNNLTSWTGGSVSVTVYGYDDESGISYIILPNGVKQNKDTVEYTITSNGKYDFTIVDNAGNGTIHTVTVDKIDKTNPRLTFRKTPEGWTNQNVNIIATGEDTESGIQNVRMTTSVNSKNRVAMRDLVKWGSEGSKFEKGKNSIQFENTKTAVSMEKYGGFYVPESLIKPNQHYVFSFDMTKVSGQIPYIGGHSQNTTDSRVEIDGKVVTRDSQQVGLNDWDSGVVYPNDNKTHHITIYLYTGKYDTAGNKGIYFQPNRFRYQDDYEVRVENIQFESGETETPYEPNYKDMLDDKNPLDITVSENGKYTFTAMDKVGNETTESILIDNIDKTPPTITIDTDGNTRWETTISTKVNVKDEESGVKTLKYQWSTSPTLPTSGVWETFTNGQTITKTTGEGNYYLHVQAMDNAGNIETRTSNVFKLDSKVPELRASVLNKQWTSGTVDIEVSSGESLSGLTGIDMVTSPEEGSNLLKHTGLTSKLKEHNFYYDEILEKDGKYAYAFVGGKNSANNITFLGQDEYELVDGKEYTFSFYAKASSPLKLKDDSGVYLNSKNSRYLNGQEISTEWERYSFNFVAKVGGKVGVHIYPIFRDSGETFYVTGWKLEYGNTMTPWTMSPEEVPLISDKKTYKVATNGEYTFKSTYNNGTTNETRINVTNIDRTPPAVTVTGNPTDYTEEDTVALTIKATDTQSGVKSITLPDKTVVNGNQATYKVTENGKYEFLITDNVGNETKIIESVDKIMSQYSFYLYDSKGKPLKGAGFDLLRDGVKYAEAESDDNGLVDFGKVPPEGKYTIKQTKAPDGYIIDPNEKDVEVGDTTEPEEFISYPRGDILPATGTRVALNYVIVIGLTLTGVAYVWIKKRK